MARPKGFAKPRSAYLSIRLTPKEKAVAEELAKAAYVTPSELVRLMLRAAVDGTARLPAREQGRG
jgi:antitoxin component of RelBE/YafQ-DinJ toxin-antitoxin module